MSALRGILRGSSHARVLGYFKGARPVVAPLQNVMIARNFSVEAPKGTPTLPDSIPAESIISDPASLDLVNAVASNGLEEVNFVVRHVMELVDSIHTMVGVPYWEAIVLTTIGLRVVLLPIVLKTTQGSARMAVMRPEMAKLQERMKEDPNMDDVKVKLKYQNEMKALFVKYKVNPMRALLWPMFQFPIFISFFMALRQMGDFYPGMATGGAWWFTDLSAADPYYIFPLLNSLTFLAMIELGSDGLQVNQQNHFKWIMRGLAVVMIPATSGMAQALFVYWTTNNVLSIGQSMLLKNKSLRLMLDIPDMPVNNAPALKMVNPARVISELMEKERSRGENAKAEILDGVKAINPKADTTQTPVFYDHAPRKKKDT